MKIRALIAGVLLVVTGCVQSRGSTGHMAAGGGDGLAGAAAGSCTDRDGDGYGEGCAPGHDCDDTDAKVHAGCVQCARPETAGCACAEGTAPVSCFAPDTRSKNGILMCHEGTRYCRQGVWSECESIHSYPAPERNDVAALIDPNAPPTQCSDCNIKCFVISDNLDPVDGGVGDAGSGVEIAAGGGLTLLPGSYSYPEDGGTVDGGSITGSTGCVQGTAPDWDCDGIEDTFDPYPYDKPFMTSNPALFLQIGPGQTGTGGIDLRFFINKLDVYMLLDQTDSMNSVKQKLSSSLTSGTYVDSTVTCADTDFDGQPNDELKDEGVFGGIHCMFRESELGLGWVREIPFSTYGNDDEILFHHALDLSGSASDALTALGTFSVDKDVDWPDAQMLGLYMVATGEGMYMGLDKPGVSPRTDCASGLWGYPCFRPDAIPVAFLFTDSPMHEGPPTTDRDFSYDPSRLTMTSGTEGGYTSIPSTNEAVSTAFDMGDLSSRYVSFAGSTSTMASDYDNTLLSCVAAGHDAAPDAAFTFTVNQSTPITVSTAGTGFGSVFGLYNHVLAAPVAVAHTGNTNETSTSALDLGDAAGNWLQVTGDTSMMAADYSGAFVGCSADNMAPDAVFKFSLSHDAQVSLDSIGTAFDGVLSLYGSAPALSTPVTATNANEDVSSALDLGDVYQRIYDVTGGTTAAMTADYADTDIGCSADSDAPDAVYSFSLSKATRVHIDTVGSSYDTVVGLSDGALGTKRAVTMPAPPAADKQDTAYDAGELTGAWLGLSGTTAGQLADYRQSFIGCNADTYSPDSVVHFSLLQPTRVRLNTIGSSFDTVISLHDGIIDPVTPVSTDNTNETASSPLVLGTVDNSWFEVYGGDTTYMTADYDASVIGCGADTFSHDAVFAFNVTSQTQVQIDTIGSTFDTVIGLFDNVPPINTQFTVPAGTESYDVGSINNGSRVYTGTTSGRGSDYGGYGMGCGTEDAPPDVIFPFHVDTSTELEINTEGSSFDTAIGLYPASVLDPKRPTATAISNTNDDKSSAYSLGNLDGQWDVVSGSTSGGAVKADFGAFGCGAASSSNDVVVKFTLSAARSVNINTRLSGFDTVIGLYDFTTDTLIQCDDNSAGGTASEINANLASGVYYVVVKGARSSSKGSYQLSVRDNALVNPISCNDDALPSGRSRLVANVDPGDYNLVLKGARAGHEGNFVVRFRDDDWWAATHELQCDDDSGGSYVSMINRTLDPGTYYVVLKGDLAVDQGPFKLTVRSLSSTVATSHTLACNDDMDGTTTDSQLESDLPAGDYWVVVKGKAGASGAYELEMRDVGTGGQGVVLQCDDDGGGGTASKIERDLPSGTYYVFVKGDAATDAGDYKLRVSDIGHTGTTAIACDNDSGGGTAAKITTPLTAGTYWAVLKGDHAGDSGAYTLSVRDQSTATRTSYACSTTGTATATLSPGTYDVVLKGSDNANKGSYMLTAGNGSTHAATFVPPSWDETLSALNAKDIRVITVLNCHDNGLHGEGRDCDYGHQQANQLANGTDALGPDLAPLVIDIDANGNGIATAIITELQRLSGYLKLNVGARVVFEPDANPGFGVLVQAVDAPGDGCDPPVGVEHQNCLPGATPSFNVSFSNPASDPVPLNPADPNGGYNFRVDLIGDGRYLIDSIPVYVIPENPSAPDPTPVYEPTGTYYQDLSPQTTCLDNERPDWQDLTWNADIPDGTSVTFNVCTSDTVGGLDSCTYHEAAQVSAAGACTTDADCAVGFCAANGICQTITSGACTSDAQCAQGSTCDTTAQTCRYAGQPVYVGSALGANNLFTYLRMQIVLNANTMTNEGPTVYDWSLTYLCRTVN